jgi:hypothetical protein
MGKSVVKPAGNKVSLTMNIGGNGCLFFWAASASTNFSSLSTEFIALRTGCNVRYYCQKWQLLINVFLYEIGKRQ